MAHFRRHKKRGDSAPKPAKEAVAPRTTTADPFNTDLSSSMQDLIKNAMAASASAGAPAEGAFAAAVPAFAEAALLKEHDAEVEARRAAFEDAAARRAAACANDMAGSAGGAGALRQDDAIVWSIINDGFCSHKVKIPTPRGRKTFCKHPNNVSGLCLKQSCPLANTRYATIREVEGKCYLYVKSVEHANCPARLWEKIKLSNSYSEALAEVSRRLAHWPKFLQHRNKQRLTKIWQHLNRMRRLRLRESAPKLVRVHKKVEKRERGKEKKALRAANLERSIEEELIGRLKTGTYKGIYNFPEMQYNAALDGAEAEADAEDAESVATGVEFEDESEGEEPAVEYVEHIDGGESDSDDSDLEDAADYVGGVDDMWDNDGGAMMDDGSSGGDDSASGASDDDDDDSDASDASDGGGAKARGPAKKRRKKATGPRVEIEYEDEDEAALEAGY